MSTNIYNLFGRPLLMNDLVRLSGVSRHTLNARLNAGWTVEQAVTTPTPKQRRAGAVSNLPAFRETGAWAVLQETSNITFSERT